MKNPQRPTPVAHSDGLELEVHSSFMTIQGEGPHAGRPAFFIRLAHCNLQCPLCDTEYSNGVSKLPLEDITELAVDNLYDNELSPEGVGGFIVLTGGEPFRQNVVPMLVRLASLGFIVQIETNGMLGPRMHSAEWRNLAMLVEAGAVDIVVSPKTHKMHEFMRQHAKAFKYVVTADDVDVDGLPIRALDHPIPVGNRLARPPENFEGIVYVQPADHKDPDQNRLNMAAAVKGVMMDDRRRLCLQMHKYAELE